jgi:hypothetical protein
MDELLSFLGVAFAFVILLPLTVYFVFLDAAPKKTTKEKIILFVLTILSAGFMSWTAYRQGYSNEIQTIIVGLVIVVGALLEAFEIMTTKLFRFAVLMAGASIFIAAGAY